MVPPYEEKCENNKVRAATRAIFNFPKITYIALSLIKSLHRPHPTVRVFLSARCKNYEMEYWFAMALACLWIEILACLHYENIFARSLWRNVNSIDAISRASFQHAPQLQRVPFKSHFYPRITLIILCCLLRPLLRVALLAQLLSANYAVEI